MFGLHNIEELSESIADKDERGKNTKDAIDCKYYELKKFIRLCLQNNPNIVEFLFIPKDKILLQTEEMDFILNNKHLFISKAIFDKFMGYAISQKKKMIIKPDNYKELLLAKEWLLSLNTSELKKHIVEYKNNNLNFLKFNDTFANIGDLNFQLHLKLSKILSIIEDRLAAASYRSDMFLKYGYDLKFASHVVRLLAEGSELLTTGNLVFPLNDAKLITDIKIGKYEAKEVMEIIETYENNFNNLKNNNNLPTLPEIHKVDKLLIDTLFNYYVK